MVAMPAAGVDGATCGAAVGEPGTRPTEVSGPEAVVNTTCGTVTQVL